MQAELNCMIEKFPGLKPKILSLFERSSEFQTLCYDYFLCVKSLDQWESNIKKSEEFVYEYKIIQKDLESELLRYIDTEDKQIG